MSAEPHAPRLRTPEPSGPPPAPEPEPPSIAVRLGRWWVPVAASVVFVVIAWELRNVLTPFLLAFLVAYALDPLVDLLERIKIPRPLGALLVFGALSTAMVFGSFYAIRYFRDEFIEAGKQVPQQIETLIKKVEPWLWKEFRFRMPHDVKELFTRYGQQIREHSPEMFNYLKTGFFGTLSAAFVVLSLLIIPVFAFYLLIDFDRIVERGGKLVPRRWQRTVFETLREVDQMISGYVRGQLLAIAILGTLYAVGLRIVGLRLAIPIGVLTGCLAFVPYIGWSTGTFLAIGMAVLDWHSGAFVLQVMAVMLVVQVLDGLFITPRVVGRSVGLGPVEVLLAMAAGGTVFGFLGVMLAVPLGATTKIVVRRLVRAYKRSDFYRRVT
jgi:predicted PurR-regulated permease PerM